MLEKLEKANFVVVSRVLSICVRSSNVVRCLSTLERRVIRVHVSYS